MIYTRRFKLGRLFYKYVKGTPLEDQGWTSHDVADLLLEHGLIRLLALQGSNERGQFTKASIYYIELEGRSMRRSDFHNLLKPSTRVRKIRETKETP